MPLDKQLLDKINAGIKQKLASYNVDLVVGTSYCDRFCSMCDNREPKPNQWSNYVLTCKNEPNCVFTVVGVHYDLDVLYEQHFKEKKNLRDELEVVKEIRKIVEDVGKELGVRIHAGVAITGGLDGDLRELKKSIFGPYTDFAILPKEMEILEIV